MGVEHDEMVVKGRLEVVAEVRGFVRLAVGRWGMDDFVPCLVASELVTNAIRHAAAEGDEVLFRLGLAEDGALWMEVRDGACTMPRMRDAGLDEESGRGLVVVDQFSRNWGVRSLGEGTGKVVFAVLDV